MDNENLIRWQWSHYPDAHRERANLLLHMLTVPLFMAGTVACAAAPFGHLLALPAGLAAMVLAMAAQGRGHRREPQAPAPFRGALDVIARIFAEQWITFPRFVLSGGWVRAWRGA